MVVNFCEREANTQSMSTEVRRRFNNANATFFAIFMNISAHSATLFGRARTASTFQKLMFNSFDRGNLDIDL